MPKETLKKILPSHNKIQEQKILKIFGELLHKREIWSLSRKRILGGVFIGMFVAFIPMPMQSILVTILAIFFNVNLPIAFAMIWISNPLTMPFIYYIEYELGNFLLKKSDAVEFNFETMTENLSAIAVSLYAGTLLLSTLASILSVLILNFLWINKVKKKRIKK